MALYITSRAPGVLSSWPVLNGRSAPQSSGNETFSQQSVVTTTSVAVSGMAISSRYISCLCEDCAHRRRPAPIDADPRWARSAIASMTRLARVSMPRSNANCLTGVASKRRSGRAWRLRVHRRSVQSALSPLRSRLSFTEQLRKDSQTQLTARLAQSSENGGAPAFTQVRQASMASSDARWSWRREGVTIHALEAEVYQFSSPNFSPFR